MTGLMAGKRGLIMGLANDRSIAWGIAKALSQHGAELAFSYQGESLQKRVAPLAASLGSDFLIDCDVADMAALDRAFDALRARWDTMDFVVHAIGFSDKNELRGKYVETSLDNFLMSMNVSVYSFTAVANRARAMMPDGGAMLTLSYYGAEKVIPHYNVMGLCKSALETSVKYLAMDLGPDKIRVNAISAGPIKTLASSGIGDFRYILKWNEYNSPLRRNVTIEEVGGAALYLLSDLGACTTGEVVFVDGGYHVTGMAQPLVSHHLRVLRQAGTEPPWSGEYVDTKTIGVYECRACGAELFRSDTKFDSHCGWPSFWSPLAGDAVELIEDRSMFMKRVEVRCANCGSHLGHVFEGEGYGTPTDQRYCINSISVRLEPTES